MIVSEEQENMKKSLILLTLNEVHGTRKILPTIKDDLADEIIVVDGGSTDGTVELFNERGFKVVSQEKRGRGEAFRVGVANTSGDLLVFFSPDGNEDVADIPKVFIELVRGADMVIASRFLPESRNEEDESVLPLRKWVNQVFSFLANKFWNKGPYVTDTINGFRGLTRQTWNRLAPQSTTFTIEYELSIRAMKRGLKITEFPTVEGNRVGGQSKVPSFRAGLIFLRLLWREICQN